MSRKRRSSETHHDGHETKQRQRMTTYHQNVIFQTTQQKLYDGSKSFFRRLKTPPNVEMINSCCSSMHCGNGVTASCNYCEKDFCSTHLLQCWRCSKTFCPFCSTNSNNDESICL